jgi:hypothetical protein
MLHTTQTSQHPTKLMWQGFVAIGLFIFIFTFLMNPRATRLGLCHVSFVGYLWNVCVVYNIILWK